MRPTVSSAVLAAVKRRQLKVSAISAPKIADAVKVKVG
jgi:hypothetical protein